MQRAEFLDEAKKCVCGQRQEDYGTPEDNFTTIGLLWSVYLRAAHPDLAYKLPINGITPKDVAVMMSLLKVARIATGSSPDSFVDLAGYAACAGEIATRTAQQVKETACVTVERPKCGACIFWSPTGETENDPVHCRLLRRGTCANVMSKRHETTDNETCNYGEISEDNV